MNPAVSQEFHFFFCEQEQLQNRQTLDKKSWCINGTLNRRRSTSQVERGAQDVGGFQRDISLVLRSFCSASFSS